MVDPARSLFASHPREWRDNLYVYPVVSRRSRGLSLGVNLNPDKGCNLDCAYCSVDRGVPARVRTVDLAVLRSELSGLIALAAGGGLWRQPPFDATPAHLRRINDIAFSGDGEPTAAPCFGEALGMAAGLVAFPGLEGVRLVVISNATMFHREQVRADLRRLDGIPHEIWAKLDAGGEDWYRRIDRSRVPFGRILDNLLLLGRERELVIQSLFCSIGGAVPDGAELDRWAGRLSDLLAGGARLARVQVYTSARATADPSVRPLAEADLEAIAARVRRLGIAVEVFP